MKVLIVEDDPSAMLILSRLVEKWGYEVITAKEGREALDKFNEEPVPLLVTDWMMPGMDGLELIQHIRARKDVEYVYIILLTALSETSDIVAGIDGGADDFINKPFNSAEFRARLRAGARVAELERNLSERNRQLAKANHRMRFDLQAAADIQASLLPDKEKITRSAHFAYRYVPCDELAGDTINFFDLDENNHGFFVLDVSGHGVPAALLAVTLSRIMSPLMDRTSLLKTRLNSPPWYSLTAPREVARQLNAKFQIDINSGQYFTCIYGIYNSSNRTVRYVSCGHPPIVQVSKNGESQLHQVRSMPVGFSPECLYDEQVLQLETGDRIFLYSDGISEAANPEDEQFGFTNLMETLQAGAHLPLGDNLDFLLEKVKNWSKSPNLADDISLLALEVLE